MHQCEHTGINIGIPKSQFLLSSWNNLLRLVIPINFLAEWYVRTRDILSPRCSTVLRESVVFFRGRVWIFAHKKPFNLSTVASTYIYTPWKSSRSRVKSAYVRPIRNCHPVHSERDYRSENRAAVERLTYRGTAKPVNRRQTIVRQKTEVEKSPLERKTKKRKEAKKSGGGDEDHNAGNSFRLYVEQASNFYNQTRVNCQITERGRVFDENGSRG